MNHYSTIHLNYPATESVFEVSLVEDYHYCREIMRSASRNYTFASKFLPKEKLPHVEALYAFLRVGDDRVDVSHGGFESPLAAIEDWEETYWQAFANGYSPHPVLRAYLNTARHFGIPKETMSAYFRAMKQDLSITRFPTFADLMYYMEGSAIPVGRAMTYILGVRSPFTLPQALPRADSLSVAMQLSNFWRDIGQDWQIGRVYLPQEDLERFQVKEEDIARARVTSKFVGLLEYQIERTQAFYTHAYPGVTMLASGRLGVMLGLKVYRAILTDIRRHQYDVFRHRARASLLEKLALVATSWWEVR